MPPILRLEKADGRFWLIVWGAATRGIRHACASWWCYGSAVRVSSRSVVGE